MSEYKDCLLKPLYSDCCSYTTSSVSCQCAVSHMKYCRCQSNDFIHIVMWLVGVIVVKFLLVQNTLKLLNEMLVQCVLVLPFDENVSMSHTCGHVILDQPKQDFWEQLGGGTT